MADKNFSSQAQQAPVTWPEERRCPNCKHIKKASDFHKDRSRKDGLKSHCKVCMRSAVRAYSQTPSGRASMQGRKRRYNLKALYGLTEKQYKEILEAQGGGCAICGRTSTANGKRLAVDHDHSCCPGKTSCGKCIRGLLCGPCNYKILGYWLHEGTKGTEQALATARRLVTYLEGNGNV